MFEAPGAGTIVVVVADEMFVIFSPGVTVEPATIGSGASTQLAAQVSVAAVELTTRIRWEVVVRFCISMPR
jgi:hypothetical protein